MTSKSFLITIIIIIYTLHSYAQCKQSHLFGYPLNSPIGIGPCPLTADAENIAHMSRHGFDVITYKTIRTAAHATHAQPCVFKVNCPSVTINDWGNTRQFSYARPITVDNCFSDASSTSFVNSCGIGSRDAQKTVQDIRASKSALKRGQVLIVSVYGSGRNKDDLIADFLACARIAATGGADIIELNLSCPNVNNNLRFMYHDAQLVHDICRAICVEFVHIPCIIKVGLFESVSQMQDVLCAAHAAGVRGVCGINTVPLRALNYDGQPLFGKGRETAGLSGAALFDVTREFVSQARKIIDEQQLDLTLCALGGVMQQEQFDQLLVAGADVVQCVTGALCNRDIASEYHHAHAATISEQKRELIKELFAIGAVQIKETKLKSGTISPIYFDARMIISHPKLLQRIATSFNEMMCSKSYDVVCGVPYGALPLATVIAIQGDYPLIMQRKEVKNYGLQKMIEGDYAQGARCCVIEDVVSTGSSILETVRILEQNGLVVNDIFVVIDREQKGKGNVQKYGYKLYSLFTITEILHILLAESLITHKQYALIKHYCTECSASA